MPRLNVGVLLLFLAGCAPDHTVQDLLGSWGGPHALLTLTTSAGNIEYDCAHGHVAPGWTVSSSGTFTATGIHLRESGGPVQIGGDSFPRPARYDGTIDGDRMSLTVTLTDSTQVLGTFLLTHGSNGSVFKCL
jgi:hypothetical protein